MLVSITPAAQTIFCPWVERVVPICVRCVGCAIAVGIAGSVASSVLLVVPASVSLLSLVCTVLQYNYDNGKSEAVNLLQVYGLFLAS
jgi:hypothetical protein